METRLYRFGKKFEFLRMYAPQTRPNGEPILDVLNATTDCPGTDREGYVQVYKKAGLPAEEWPYEELSVSAEGGSGTWFYIEDHTQKMDEKGQKYGGTPYWTAGDTWRSEPRYIEELGPLPEDVLLERPERPLDEYKSDKRREIAAGYTAALTATLTMPAESPSPVEVATGAALFAADDAVGLADVQTILIARRDKLLAAIDAATNREALEDIVIDYPV